jgi:negative regulator of flagellin synthesis FlgM
MKIESSNKTASTPLATRAQSTGKASSAGKDDVQLSALSAQLSAADDEQSFDAARVSEIKQAIADGRFTINTGAIADRLIASARQLVDSQRQG